MHTLDGPNHQNWYPWMDWKMQYFSISSISSSGQKKHYFRNY
jgi:hypothetical protein